MKIKGDMKLLHIDLTNLKTILSVSLVKWQILLFVK